MVVLPVLCAVRGEKRYACAMRFLLDGVRERLRDVLLADTSAKRCGRYLRAMT
jgi:hypothetical protein